GLRSFERQTGGFFGLKRAGQFVQVTTQNAREFPGGEAYAVVGYARLGEVVGADAFRAVAGADLYQAGFARGVGGPGALTLQDAGSQHGQRALLVLDLRFTILAGHDDLVGLAGEVRDAHGGVRGVDGLPSGPTGAV